MGFFDYLTGGNAKVAANTLADIHYTCNGEYWGTYTLVLSAILNQAIQNPNNKTVIAMEMVRRNEILNYTDLAVLNLNLNVAPAGMSYAATYSDFSQNIIKYLIRRNILMQFISGDNRHLTRDFVSSLAS
ncbi:hypothetical protein [Desulfovibrio intestinalis]|uniref:Uncharacterized protein n=1 Tax=Desulfovibrio intestinalis TaxID=58621 RepID=A0A7W8C3K8_9BACT|nr:hypothetical protein [Desulfovibrio intestinalis]MBB5143654.1 hypothetical protein [Desulfovibrio intestinalis]